MLGCWEGYTRSRTKTANNLPAQDTAQMARAHTSLPSHTVNHTQVCRVHKCVYAAKIICIAKMIHASCELGITMNIKPN